MAGSAHSKAQRLERHKRLHPNDAVAAKATGARTQKSKPKSKRWTRELRTFAQMAVLTGYKGTAVLYEWARGDIYGGRRLTDAKAIAHEKARQQARREEQEKREKLKQQKEAKKKEDKPKGK